MADDIHAHKKNWRKPLPSQEELRHLLNYDPNTGIFRWSENCGKRRKAGGIVGCKIPSNSGLYYIYIRIGSYVYPAHRLAWIYIYGDLSADIDHKDRDGTNNKISNLRLATRSQNNFNQQRRGKSGVRGVRRTKYGWQSRITINGKHETIGTFENIEDAGSAYMKRAIELFGEFYPHK